MPELPDVTVYVESLRRFVVGHPIQKVLVASPFVMRTFDPPISSLVGKTPRDVTRMAKRIVIHFDDDLFLVVHLMVAGRFHWKKTITGLNAKVGLAAFAFDHGTLVLTEASSKKRAAMHLVRGRDAVQALDAGGIDALESDFDAFAAALRRENHTLKRALTDPTLLGGIGNAYSDEILHAAKLSPVLLTQKLDDARMKQLYEATQSTLRTWTARLRKEAGAAFPEKVTAFRDGMAVHGRHGKPCPVCGTAVQRIVKAENESNYCPTCQTGGKLLADRALSRLLREDWPKTVEEMELRRRTA